MESLTIAWKWLTDHSRWPARWSCGKWHWAEAYADIAADLIICAELTMVAIVAMVLLWKNPKLGISRPLSVLLMVFFPLCGLTHAANALMFIQPYYIVGLALKIITAVTGAELCVQIVKSFTRIASYRSEEEYLEMIADRDRMIAQRNEMIVERDCALRAKDDSTRKRLQLRKEVQAVHDEIADIAGKDWYLAQTREADNLRERLQRLEQATQPPEPDDEGQE